MKFNEMIYWNKNSYGKAITISKWHLRSFIVAIGILVPIIIPIPLCVFISSRINNNLVWRY